MGGLLRWLRPSPQGRQSLECVFNVFTQGKGFVGKTVGVAGEPLTSLSPTVSHPAVGREGGSVGLIIEVDGAVCPHRLSLSTPEKLLRLRKSTPKGPHSGSSD